MEEVSLTEWYRGQTVLLTGATGFLGKVVMEKLLRTTQLDRIFILVRPKKGKEATKRADELFSDPIFERLKKEIPEFMDKLCVIEGDIAQPNLGITEFDAEALVNQVTLVIHGAATVKFNEKLKMAVDINVRGPKHLLALCKEMKQLKSVVHVSTAYSQCIQPELQEKLYKPPITGQNLVQLCDCLNDEQLDSITDSIIGPWPNTYTFTKAVAEDMVKNCSTGLKVAIVRPSIVTGSYEFMPGWVDNMNGPMGVVAAVAVGLMRTMTVRSDAISDIVPVDLTANCIIAAARHAAKNKTTEIPVFNYSSSKRNPLTWEQFFDFNFEKGTCYPMDNCMWYPTLTMTSNRIFYKFLALFYHILPALLVDLVMLARNKPPWLLKMYEKIHKFNDLLEFFSTRSWLFHDENVNRLFRSMSKEDRMKYNFDIASVDWINHQEYCVKGVRHYIFKEKDDSLPRARRKFIAFKILHYTTLAAIYSTCGWIMYSLVSRILW